MKQEGEKGEMILIKRFISQYGDPKSSGRYITNLGEKDYENFESAYWWATEGNPEWFYEEIPLSSLLSEKDELIAQGREGAKELLRQVKELEGKISEKDNLNAENTTLTFLLSEKDKEIAELKKDLFKYDRFYATKKIKG